ncbi:hypothetical protein [Enterovirga aerilata]|uniref:Peptidase inhibitor family I36 protein n=1 Tax=Enterovirga aerilata TaxID=2730920 RepID=A0A849I0D5_9HYPH|nr:hypothetical protein [Enterovirga sp. DB1703]NNM70861.1 hypothetical protein [Enterovirga sp. DB1703]
MREFEYPLARARRIRARRAVFGGSSSLLVCAALALIFLTPDEGRRTGSSPSPALEVAPAQAMAPATARLPLPADRVMTIAPAILEGGQAPDIWSTPLKAEPTVETAALSPEMAVPALPQAEEPAAGADTEPPRLLFEHASLVDQPVAIEGRNPAGLAVLVAASAPAPLTFASVAGRWASHPSACSDRKGRSAYLPLLIDERGAKAGGASCSFRRTAQDGNRWSVTAACADATERWDAHVRLVLAGNRLTWSSERGTQTYTRCR